MPPSPITETARAKINLTLHVTGRRGDGYHLLDSLVAFAEVGDILTAQPAATPGLRCGGRFGAAIPRGGDNLVMRAAAVVPGAPGLAFSLDKRLPPASGIGGGSADAAAAIRALLRARGEAGWGDAPEPDAAAVAALGADVPVCLGSRPVRMRGIGEVLDPIGFPGAPVVLANPMMEVPTADVFRALATPDNAPMPRLLPSWGDAAALAAWLRTQRNDLEPPARRVAPVIGKVLAALAAQRGALVARMSGSGATCFALFGDSAGAEAAGTALNRTHPGWWISVSRLLPSVS